MSDRVTSEDLAETAPDPTVDFGGFLEKLADRVIAEHEEISRLAPLYQREIYVLRALERLSRGLSHNHPRPALQLYARNVVNSIGRWQAALEQPDNGGKG